MQLSLFRQRGFPYKNQMSRIANQDQPENQSASLRRGWTTGACATAATKSALAALLEGDFIDPVTITLPKGDTPSFALAHEKRGGDFAEAGIVKDAGDDPDVTHGATIIARISRSPEGSGVTFKAGEGVGTVTKSGLPIAVGEAAINPVPRQLMENTVREMAARNNTRPDFQITVSVPGGEELAERTWNPRLGIIGGISILGTTGVVHPFSCSAWIHSIHRGIDVCRAEGINHVLGATGSTSETAACKIHKFPEIACLDMGDFVGGLLKYMRSNPVPRITIAGGFAKMTKLAQGAMDLHSGRSQVDFDWLAEVAEKTVLNQSMSKWNQDMKSRIQNANTAMEVLEMTQDYLPQLPLEVADKAQQTALGILRGAPVEVEIMVFDRSGALLAQTGWKGPNG